MYDKWLTYRSLDPIFPYYEGSLQTIDCLP